MFKRMIKMVTPKFALGFYHRTLAFLGACVYGFPSRKIRVIGVTGTKGKTSTVYFIAKILEHAGYRVGAISGLYFKIGDTETPNTLKMTMPGRFFLQQQLRKMVDAGCVYAVLEVTSEGIAQHRHRFIDFDTTIFTNIAPEHLESHGGFEKYLAVKQKLFAVLVNTRRKKSVRGKLHAVSKTIIVNGDDPHAQEFLEYPANRKFCCYVGQPDASQDEELSACEHLVAHLEEITEERIVFRLLETVFALHIPGIFNVGNAVLAIAAGLAEGLAPADMAEALGGIKNLPGRMERITAPSGFEVFVDYAHTPDSLEAVYRTLRLQFSKNPPNNSHLICVLGAAGGGRDRWKRPLLGAVAGVWGDLVIVTNEDPYDENPARIIDEVAKGVEQAPEVYRRYFGEEMFKTHAHKPFPKPERILDRRDAIRTALMLAKAGDRVAISGKGSEQVMAITGGKKVPWDDREVVRQELARLSQK